MKPSQYGLSAADTRRVEHFLAIVLQMQLRVRQPPAYCHADFEYSLIEEPLHREVGPR